MALQLETAQPVSFHSTKIGKTDIKLSFIQVLLSLPVRFLSLSFFNWIRFLPTAAIVLVFYQLMGSLNYVPYCPQNIKFFCICAGESE